MTASSQVINAILKSIEAIFLPGMEISNLTQAMKSSELGEIPALEEFLNPPPDIEDDKVHSRHSILLGSYRPMCSPGIITLYATNLTNFFWRLVLEIDAKLNGWDWSEEELKMLAIWVVNKTYYHERFHHSMDVLRHLFNVQAYDSLQEEALAVAYAHYRLRIDNLSLSRSRRPQFILLLEFLRLAFDYKSEGYCRWDLFAHRKSKLESGRRF